MKNKKYCVTVAINHRENKGLDWSTHSKKMFDSKEEAEEYYTDIILDFDFKKYRKRDYKFNICLFEPIITKRGEILTIPGKILEEKKYKGRDFT